MFGLLLPMSGGAASASAVGLRRARRLPSFRIAIQVALAVPVVVSVRGWTAPPARASLSVRWSSPLLEVTGRSVPAFRASVRDTITIAVQASMRARAAPPVVELSGEELLVIADHFLDA